MLLEVDDVDDISSSRARAAACPAISTGWLPRRSTSSHFSSTDGSSNRVGGRENGTTRLGNEGKVAADEVDSPNGSGCDYGIAAFSLDSSCEVGRVVLVYGCAPLSDESTRQRPSCKGQGPLVTEITSPEVWLQDMSCR